MAAAVGAIIGRRGRIVIEAPTGVGKSLGYLAPVAAAIAEDPTLRVLVTTAGLGLMDQIADVDLPRVRRLAPNMTSVVVRGRAQYACMLKANNLELIPGFSTELSRWALSGGHDGERRQAPLHTDEEWRGVSVSDGDCIGADKCPLGVQCFAERTRGQAKIANLVVTNMHLMAKHATMTTPNGDPAGILAGERPFNVHVIDEAHELLDISCSVNASTITPGQLFGLAAALRKANASPACAEAVHTAAKEMQSAIRRLPNGGNARYRSGAVMDPTMDRILSLVSGALQDPFNDTEAEGSKSARMGLARQIEATLRDVERIRNVTTHVQWLDENGLTSSPTSIAFDLAERAWEHSAVVACSATMPTTVVRDIGLGISQAGSVAPASLRVPTPFDLARHGLLYVAADLPRPSERERFEAAAVQRCRELVAASRGGAMVLCTSTAAVARFASALRADGWTVFAQGEGLSKDRMVTGFTADHDSVLVGTRGFWQGVSVEGSTCRHVIIDRIPFPRPDDPMVNARREQLVERFLRSGTDQRSAEIAAFNAIDVPLAATAVAQGAGRGHRTITDLAVVSLLDSRLDWTAERRPGYLPTLLACFGAMPRTTTLVTVSNQYRTWFPNLFEKAAA